MTRSSGSAKRDHLDGPRQGAAKQVTPSEKRPEASRHPSVALQRLRASDRRALRQTSVHADRLRSVRCGAPCVAAKCRLLPTREVAGGRAGGEFSCCPRGRARRAGCVDRPCSTTPHARSAVPAANQPSRRGLPVRPAGGFRYECPSRTMTCAWWSSRSIAADAISSSRNMGYHSSSARFEVMTIAPRS